MAVSQYNKTIKLSEKEIQLLSKKFVTVDNTDSEPKQGIINSDIFEVINKLPKGFIDLMIIDPPYNIRKEFNGTSFDEMSDSKYEEWFESWFAGLIPLLKPEGTVYICCDWKTSPLIYNVARKYLKVQNRITWEREKGRGAKSNWKNCTEDIFFLTNGNKYTFNLDSVKLVRKVLAPYKDEQGKPKDWEDTDAGKFRLTHPSNIWTDIVVPFWSMPENTEHPTQKPEKLIAKLILASSNEGDFVFDPFLGSGTTAVVAKKLGRKFLGCEIDPLYAALGVRRLELADENKKIQGYSKGIFYERNLSLQLDPEKLETEEN